MFVIDIDQLQSNQKFVRFLMNEFWREIIEVFGPVGIVRNFIFCSLKLFTYLVTTISNVQLKVCYHLLWPKHGL